MTKLKAQITNEFQNPNFEMFILPAATVSAFAIYLSFAFCHLALLFKATSKNVIPVKTRIYNQLKLLDSRFRGSDRLGIIRGSLKIISITGKFKK